MLFFREDGSYLPVLTAIREDYAGLIDWDVPTLAEAGHTVMLRFEASVSILFGDTMMLIGCLVAWLSIRCTSGKLVDMVSPGGGLRTGIPASDPRLVRIAK